MRLRASTGAPRARRPAAQALAPERAAALRLSLFPLLGLILISCDLVGLIDPPYVGRWKGEDTMIAPLGGFQPELDLTLGRTEFRWIDRLRDASGRQADLFGLKGGAGARGSTLTLSIDSVGQAPLGSGGLPAGALVWSASGTPEYEQVVAALPSTELEARYTIAEAVMTLILDLNGDGAFDDRDPLLSLTRQ